jgi:hypothetical protein
MTLQATRVPRIVVFNEIYDFCGFCGSFDPVIGYSVNRCRTAGFGSELHFLR